MSIWSSPAFPVARLVAIARLVAGGEAEALQDFVRGVGGIASRDLSGPQR